MAPSLHAPSRLALSYVFDWIIILGIAVVGVGFWKVGPNHRPFSPVDPDISFPFVEHEKVSTGLLVTLSLIIPAIATAFVALVFTPRLSKSRGTPVLSSWKYKLWEWNTAWMGLGLTLATTFFFVEGLKNLVGKPRPDLLSRCNLDPAAVDQYALGGEGSQLPLWNLLVSYTACKEPDKSKINDGFQSFPSGHASFSWAGLSYLALFLCSRFSVSVPYLLPHSYVARSLGAASTQSNEDPLMTKDDPAHSKTDCSSVTLREQAAAPPAYLFILPLVPISIATYVASTRYSDFRHHGFDILFGASMGTLISWTSFRMYHMPIRRGSGWSWGPRSVSKAFGIKFGVQRYVEDEQEANGRDLEAGNQSRHARVASSSQS